MFVKKKTGFFTQVTDLLDLLLDAEVRHRVELEQAVGVNIRNDEHDLGGGVPGVEAAGAGTGRDHLQDG